MKLLILSLFLLTIPSIYSYNCSIAREPATCSQLPACRFLHDSCLGNFPDPHPNITSYFIDPINGSDIHSGFGGNINSPFKTLDYAIKALMGRDGAIIVLNHKRSQPIEIKSQIFINSSVTLKPLFEDWDVLVDLQKFNVSRKSALNIQKGGDLTLIKVRFDSISSRRDLEAIFEVENDAQLNFNNVNIFNGDIQAKIVRSTGSNSQFSYEQGSYKDSSFTFDLQGGRHEIYKVRFDGINTTRPVFSLNQASLTIDEINVKRGESMFIHMENESVLQVDNSTLSSYAGSFLYARDPSFISVKNSLFRKVSSKSPVPFIHITGNKIQTQFIHSIKQTRFLDMNLKSSLILIDKAMTSIVLENVNMNKILQENRGYSRGACLAAENEVSVLIEKSVFTGINTTCLDLDSSSLQLKNNVFDNSWSSGLERQASDSRGITWVSLNEGTNSVGAGFLVKILSNNFKENKFAPLNGGALKITGEFPGTVIIKDNNFTGNQAIASGGAIYSNNINQKFEIEDNKFTDNFAHIAGAIHIVNNSTSVEEKESQVSLKDVKFIKNKSYQGPVVIVAEAERLFEENCLYEGNQELKYIQAQKRFTYQDL